MSLVDTLNYADFTANSAFFFIDNGQEAGSGAVNFIHIYNHALTAADVAALPPPVELPEPAPLGMMAAGLALVGWTRRRKAK